ncbi:hypothetical protein CAMGR0001_1608 [Campylobacter gracilis RM3268]|uniref:Uncharacterized protein n=1 Tax=Campylobacter gracilis RM3268 TaxID=553220 RepID=C8PIE7_9BACT|nr:hypothetical protein CAMGR0001_1608 [Campylobacter gracilis RM3268]
MRVQRPIFKWRPRGEILKFRHAKGFKIHNERKILKFKISKFKIPEFHGAGKIKI